MAKKMGISICSKALLVFFGVIIALAIVEASLQLSFLINSAESGKLSQRSGEYTILALGESTTADMHNGHGTWPGELEKLLNNNSAGIRFRVINMGKGGINTAFILYHLEENIERYNPDMVITMMGKNDERLSFVYHAPAQENFLEGLRIIKLARWIARAFFAKQESEGIGISDYAADSPFLEDSVYSGLVAEGIRHYDNNNLEEAISLLSKAAELNQGRKEAYKALGLAYYRSLEFEKSVESLKKAASADNNDIETLQNLGFAYSELGMYEEAAKQIETILLIDRDNEQAFSYLMWLYVQLNKTKERQGYLEKRGFVGVQKEAEATKDHYLKLYDILQEHNIVYAAMQYPNEDLSKLKEILGGREVIYISNLETFRSAVAQKGYSYYFIDDAGGIFGHATIEGNRLIAGAAAAAIFRYLNFSSG